MAEAGRSSSESGPVKRFGGRGPGVPPASAAWTSRSQGERRQEGSDEKAKWQLNGRPNTSRTIRAPRRLCCDAV